MRPRATLVLMSLLVVSVGTSLWPADEPVDFCALMQVASSGPVSRPAATSQFSASQVEDLQLTVQLLGRVGPYHVLELEVYTPNGHLYQVLAAPVTTDAARAGELVQLPGYARAMPMQVLRRVRTREGPAWVATLTMPVAGTYIVTNSLYGDWELKPRLDATPMSCERRFLFTLTE